MADRPSSSAPAASAVMVEAAVDGHVVSYLRECHLEQRMSDGAMFVQTRHGIMARLRGYAIVPVEKYRELLELRSARYAELAASAASPAPAASGGQEAVRGLSREDICQLWQWTAINKPSSMTVEGFTSLLLNEIDSRSDPAQVRSITSQYLDCLQFADNCFSSNGLFVQARQLRERIAAISPAALAAPAATGGEAGDEPACWTSEVSLKMAAQGLPAPIHAYPPPVEPVALYRQPLAKPEPALSRDDCGWPAGHFTVHDEGGEHDPCYVVMPGGAMIPFNHHPGKNEGGDFVDVARARFVAAACNAALTHPAPSETGASAEVRVRALEWRIMPSGIWHTADSILGTYCVYPEHHYIAGTRERRRSSGMDDGRAKCQADYEARIRAALG